MGTVQGSTGSAAVNSDWLNVALQSQSLSLIDQSSTLMTARQYALKLQAELVLG